jgi:hypothetical protein
MFFAEDILPAVRPRKSDSHAANERNRQAEKEWVNRAMAGFCPEQSPPWLYFKGKYGPHITKQMILSLGEICSRQLNLSLVRNYRRRKKSMLKWFALNWDVIHQFLENQLEVVQ